MKVMVVYIKLTRLFHVYEHTKISYLFPFSRTTKAFWSKAHCVFLPKFRVVKYRGDMYIHDH